ncbi:hypothetical protein O181_054742 [Austropuccinia psidii MF-1]|uniref:RNase H type-1 domain-containing protein n=1 Tax=Austropuccinia psidii MF-1 TaxID=1389203 RepID=A0A9Q3EC93_9BASI|nr:hypothetical protein [Austropuccinia psidii MF-1]
MIDSNLHHNLWNPASYNHQHMEAKDLIRMCGKKGFKLISPRQVPTFFGATGRPTTIDLTWENHKDGKLQITTNVQLNNHSSYHQPILTTINFPEDNLTPNLKHLAIHRGKIDQQKVCRSLSFKLQALPNLIQTSCHNPIDEQVEGLTKALRDAMEAQGKWVTTNKHRMKPWWNTTILNPLARARNKARRNMLKTQTNETRTTYYQCQQLFKKKIWELKTSHWRNFLAERGPENMYQAYKFTKSRMTGEIAPLNHNDGSLTTEVEEKAVLLFQGTSVTEGGTEILDTPIPLAQEHPGVFPPVPPEEIQKAINSLPNNKAAGSDTIPNEILKIAAQLLLPILTPLFNACLAKCHYPTPWKTSLTAIIRKNDKDDYSNPSAYHPIALLNTLGKLFEKVINNCLTFWSTSEEVLHPGHMGGTPGRNINDALTVLTSWIYGKWRENKVIVGTFLDSFNAPNGLPQGSPLLVMLYLLYNTDLLLPTPLTLESKSTSIAYVDNVVHLVAAKSQQEGLQQAKQAMVRSWSWGQHHGAIFDKKKTNIVLFTKKKIQYDTIHIKDQLFPLQKEVRWLGVQLTNKLNFNQHIKNLKQKINATFAQLQRIIKPTYGLSQKDAHTLVSTVLATQIMHGSIIWYTKNNEMTVRNLLMLWFNRAVRLSTGMMRQTPQIFLEKYSGIPNFTRTHTKLTHNYVHNRLASLEQDPIQKIIINELFISPKSHQSPLHKILGRNTLQVQHQTRAENRVPFPIPPWATPICPIKNIHLTKEKAKELIASQVERLIEDGALTFFTDGSLIPGKGGGAAVLLANDGTELRTYVGHVNLLTNFDTELIALHLCIDMINTRIENGSNPKGIAIFCDSRTAIESIALPQRSNPSQVLIVKLHNKLKNWNPNCPIRLLWCPGHSNVPQNERVDQLAKEAAQTQQISEHTQQTISISKLKQHKKYQLMTPPPLTPAKQLQIKFKTPAPLIIEALDNLKKGLAATIHQLRTGHVPLNDYLHRIKQTEKPICKTCNTLKTPSHYLIICKNF